MTPVMTRYPNRARYDAFMMAAAESLRLAAASPTRDLKRHWLEQALFEIERADDALYPHLEDVI